MKQRLISHELDKKCNEASNNDDAVQIYNENLRNIFDELCPLQSKLVRENKKQAPWFTKHLKEQRLLVAKAHKEHKRHPEDGQLKKDYNQLRNAYAKNVKNTRKDYYNDELCKSKDPKNSTG